MWTMKAQLKGSEENNICSWPKDHSGDILTKIVDGFQPYLKNNLPEAKIFGTISLVEI